MHYLKTHLCDRLDSYLYFYTTAAFEFSRETKAVTESKDIFGLNEKVAKVEVFPHIISDFRAGKKIAIKLHYT